MAYLENLFGPQASRLNRALGQTSARQSALMNNLANVNTPGYKRQDVDFNILLEETQEGFDQYVAHRNARKRAADNSSLRPDGNNVDMEFEVMSIAETETRYNALTEFTSRHFAGLKSVIRDGR